jgi:hypothetical protein
VNYRVVYDVRHAMPNSWWLILIPLILAPAGYAIFREAHRFEEPKAGIFGLGLMFMAGLGVLFVVGGSVIPYLGMRSRVLRGAYRIVEGTVRDFVPGGAHQSESWVLESDSTVDSYSYSPSIVDAGYDQTAPDGGEVREGLRVRVWDVDGRIARLENGR